jgi:hypothetical protein
MASHPATVGSASALPLHIALSVIPSLPRPLLVRFVARAIERLDSEDDDPSGIDEDEDNGDDERSRQPVMQPPR